MTQTISMDSLELHRSYLLRIARQQLRDRHLAEDLVQDTLLAAWQGADRFGGRSSERTWLTGILKHKIVDAIRRKVYEREHGMSGTDLCRDNIESDMDDAGDLASIASVAADPEAQLSQRQFFDVLQLCIARLPANAARAFVLREMMELETAEICQEMNISANNLWVLIYRARVALRQMLEQCWLQVPAHAAPHVG